MSEYVFQPIPWEPLKIDSELPKIHENVLLDLASIPVLPEPDDLLLLNDLDLDAVTDRMVQELPNGNWIFLEFEDSIRMTHAQRECLLYASALTLDPFLGLPVVSESVKCLRDHLRSSIQQIADTESEPGTFAESLHAASAHYRLNDTLNKQGE